MKRVIFLIKRELLNYMYGNDRVVSLVVIL